MPVSAEYDYYACMSNWCLDVDFILERKEAGRRGRKEGRNDAGGARAQYTSSVIIKRAGYGAA